MDRYCLLIPLPARNGICVVKEDGRTSKRAVVFDDWDIINELGTKSRGSICDDLFG